MEHIPELLVHIAEALGETYVHFDREHGPVDWGGARSMYIEVHNTTRYTLLRESEACDHGDWGTNTRQIGFEAKLPPEKIGPGEKSTLIAIEKGIMTGVKGWVKYREEMSGAVVSKISFYVPYWAGNEFSAEQWEGFKTVVIPGTSDNCKVSKKVMICDEARAIVWRGIEAGLHGHPEKWDDVFEGNWAYGDSIMRMKLEADYGLLPIEEALYTVRKKQLNDRGIKV